MPLLLLPLLLLLLLAATAQPARSAPSWPLPWAPTPEAEGFDARTLEGIQPAVQQLVDDHTVPGAVVLGARHGKLVLNVTRGNGTYASAEPLIFRLFSMSKPVVAVLALALVDAGRLALDDPIGRYLPELATPQVYQGQDSFGGWITTPSPRCGTVRELMTHTAGFTYGFHPESDPVDRAYALAGFADMHDTQSNSDAFIRTLSAIPLIGAPNTTWRYSVGFDVLGVLIERVGGKPLDVLLEEHVTGPLGMRDTGFWVPLDKAHQLPAVDVEYNDTPYNLTPLNENSRPPFFSGGSGLYSTADDYIRLLQMLLNEGELDGVRVLSREAVRAMVRSQVPSSLLLEFNNWKGGAFGLGVQVTSVGEAGPNRPLGEISWGGFAGTHFFCAPATGTALVTLTQHAPINGALPGAIKPRFFEALRVGGGVPAKRA